MKRTLLFIFTIFFISNSFAQDTLEKKNRLTKRITERFHVIKGNEEVKEGLYQALYKRNTAIASGNYNKGKKAGVWYFYNTNGKVLQIYNYNKDSLQFEAREDTTSNLRYLVDKEIRDTDRVTKPIKAGGRYYGYLPYLGIYKTPFDTYTYGSSPFIAIVELLVSPLGRLANYKVRVISGLLDYDQTTSFSIKLFKEEDRKFIPATFNGQPIMSRIVIKCRITDDGGLDFF